MNIGVRPDGNDRFVDVEHTTWTLRWKLQFPEMITSQEGAIMAWPSNCRPEWEQLDDNGWGYTWRTTPAYGVEVSAMNLRDSAGNPQYPKFFTGLALRGEITCRGHELRLSLTLSNESSATVHSVSCDGGCWQAKSEAFMNRHEIARSYAMVGEKMVNMASLPRTVAMRCMYRCDPAKYDGCFEWFWGRSAVAIDYPAILGATSGDGTKSLVLGYEGAVSASANSDGHHCLHSAPFFGDIAPGQSVTRIGYVLFGSDIHHIAGVLRKRLKAAHRERDLNTA